jgi:hypothetical protein
VARHLSVVNLRRANVDAYHVRDLTAPVDPTTTWPTGIFPLAQAHDQLFAKLAHRQRVNSVVDGFPADVSVFKIHFHTSQLARDLLGRKAFSKQVDNPFKPLIARHELPGRAAGLSTLTSKGLGLTGHIALNERFVSSQLTADRRRATPDQASGFTLAEVLILANLNGHTLFNAEFGIRHRGTLPEVEVLHSIFAAAAHKTYHFFCI